MSRVPKSASSTSTPRVQGRTTPSSSRSAPPLRRVPATPTKLRVPDAPTARRSPSPQSKASEIEQKTVTPRLSIKEQIALKRAEAKKAQTSQDGSKNGSFNEHKDMNEPMSRPMRVEEESIDLGRLSIREVIERARSTGSVNLSSRTLLCIPSCLFEIHLNITPKPLESITEPDYSVEESSRRTKQHRPSPSWFEAQDLTILKVRSNEIAALQPELALFGGLKVLDLHSNRLQTLPTSLSTLALLTTLDVSNNNLTEIPSCLFALPALTTLNLAYNQLTSLPFSKFDEPVDLSDMIYQLEVSQAVESLPNLHVLDVSHNKLSAAAIDVAHLPRTIRRFLIPYNPLGKSVELLSALAKLKELQEVIMDHAELSDDSFVGLAPSDFPNLQLLDVSETHVTEESLRIYFTNSSRNKAITFLMSNAPPVPGELRVSVGKKIIREAWEIEAEKHYLRKKKSFAGSEPRQSAPVQKEDWEIEADKGLNKEVGRRRTHMAVAITSISSNASVGPSPTNGASFEPKVAEIKPKEVIKEQWEIDAEQGLLTEGGRRRLRAQEAAKAARASPEPEPEPAKVSGVVSLANSSYYCASTFTLTLPASAPRSRSHSRAFSLAANTQKTSRSDDLLVPVPTLPLGVIARQDFAVKLRVLNLNNRRADPTFNFPPSSFLMAKSAEGVLPYLEELYLQSCALNDTVSVSQESEEGVSPVVQKKGLLEVIADTFPILSVLDLTYNALTSDGLSSSVLHRLLVPNDGHHKGLKVLRLRGNRLAALDEFDSVAAMFCGSQSVPGWRLEELDVRDNEISKLPVLLGLMPMDVFLVEGNTFRVPQRRVWERDGTKGLLTWLRSRIE